MLFLAVVAGQYAASHVEVGEHGFVVGDALGVVALHDADDLVRCGDRLFLYDLIVADDAENDIGRHDRQTGYLVVGEKLVAHLDDALGADFL